MRAHGRAGTVCVPTNQPTNQKLLPSVCCYILFSPAQLRLFIPLLESRGHIALPALYWLLLSHHHTAAPLPWTRVLHALLFITVFHSASAMAREMLLSRQPDLVWGR